MENITELLHTTCFQVNVVLVFREQGIGLQLLLRWSHEQIQGARLALDSTAKALRDLRKNADKLKQARSQFHFGTSLVMPNFVARQILKALHASLLKSCENSFFPLEDCH